ncbi:MAG: hypothetical protein IT381_14150 [Deltaproteobacteria bacterium]|nr:hypothetical protein [Deltaproteobacteria bacterium]
MGAIANKAAGAKAPTPQPRATAAPQAAPAPQQQRQAQAPGGASFGNAKPRGANGFFLKPISRDEAGQYTLKVNRITQKWAQPKVVAANRPQPTDDELATAQPAFKKKDSFIIEVEVVESNVPQCPPGYIASISFDDKYEDSYFSNVKGFLCACTGEEPEAIGLEDWQASYQPDQPLSGALFCCTVREQPTKDGKGVFTLHVCTPSPLQHPEEAAQESA